MMDEPWDEYDPNAVAEQEAGEPREIPDDMVRRSWVSPGCKMRDEIAYAVEQYWPEAKARRLVRWMDREMDYRHAREYHGDDSCTCWVCQAARSGGDWP